ncbi:30S ribosome-binding factor RbfA [Psychroflexus sp. CAK57W]|uniref:30S ribosome-binding factor RbfA n=1 Tax=Psychroflexus curvus TaxID=2873595 RepID=UPI001CCF3B3C|nr:30S ribosome-binding factor RbfA [Psychroflexus curvus]MBZ9628936.1 30S ribosome-binding factor RbfA [Psychroflexus curvus]MBZ9787322.1 30S ribosome-binding factor RbfA [Psychroflexus curvus]
MESNRQKKIAGILQKDLAEVIQLELKAAGTQNLIISVTKVRVTPDLLQARVHLSIFPSEKSEQIVEEIRGKKSKIKHEVAQRTKHQLRRMPELTFFNDDSIEYINDLEQAFKGKNDPIKNPDLIDKRKKN